MFELISRLFNVMAMLDDCDHHTDLSYLERIGERIRSIQDQHLSMDMGRSMSNTKYRLWVEMRHVVWACSWYCTWLKGVNSTHPQSWVWAKDNLKHHVASAKKWHYKRTA